MSVSKNERISWWRWIFFIAGIKMLVLGGIPFLGIALLVVSLWSIFKKYLGI